MNDLQLEILQVLDKAEQPMTLKDLYPKCQLAADAVAVANATSWLARNSLVGREKRKGIGPGGFVMAYSINDAGKEACKQGIRPPESPEQPEPAIPLARQTHAPEVAAKSPPRAAPEPRSPRRPPSAAPPPDMGPSFAVDHGGQLSIRRDGATLRLSPAEALELLRFMHAVETVFEEKQEKKEQ
ncbi:MAG: hypothetical protein M0T84_00180 [Betaproteobacteria bacterium]|nr:hypothetical protein [Betaproteobacteria bacterium]